MGYKLKKQNLTSSDAATNVAIELLSRARNRPNFGNAGELENLLGVAKNNYQKRMSSVPYADRPADISFEPQDFDPDYNRGANATSNLKELFKDVIGCEEIVQKLEGYQRIAHASKQQGRDPRNLIPTNFVFKGPPGRFPNFMSPKRVSDIEFRHGKDDHCEEDGTGLLRHGAPFFRRSHRMFCF